MNQELFTAIVDESPDDILVLEPICDASSGQYIDARIVFANETAALNAQTSVPQLIGQCVLEAFPHWQNEGLWQTLSQAICNSKGTSDRVTGTHMQSGANINYSILICGLEKTAVIRLRDMNVYTKTVEELEKQKQALVGAHQKLADKDKALKAAHNKLVVEMRARKSLRRRLSRTAQTDGLTGFLNRHAFLEIGQAELRRTRRYGEALSLVVADIDHFKKIVEQYGRDGGERTIVAVSELLSSSCRMDIDRLGRIGEDRFVILLPSTKLSNAIIMAERLRDKIAQLDIWVSEALFPDDPDCKTQRITISFGVSGFSKEVGDLDENLIELMKRADAALSHAKHQGRNRVGSQEEARK